MLLTSGFVVVFHWLLLPPKFSETIPSFGHSTLALTSRGLEFRAYWVAVKDRRLSYYKKETRLRTIFFWNPKTLYNSELNPKP